VTLLQRILNCYSSAKSSDTLGLINLFLDDYISGQAVDIAKAVDKTLEDIMPSIHKKFLCFSAESK
jgi:hypothetical protein